MFPKLFGVHTRGKPTQTSTLACHRWTRPRMLPLHCPVTSSPAPTARAYSNAPAEAPPQIHPCSADQEGLARGTTGPESLGGQPSSTGPRVHHLDGILPSPPKSTSSSSCLGGMGKSSPSGCYKHLRARHQVTSLWQSKYARSLAVWHFSQQTFNHALEFAPS